MDVRSALAAGCCRCVQLGEEPRLHGTAPWVDAWLVATECHVRDCHIKSAYGRFDKGAKKHELPAGRQTTAAVASSDGARMLDVLTFLEAQQGGSGPAPGYSFPHTPAPGNLTVG